MCVYICHGDVCACIYFSAAYQEKEDKLVILRHTF